MIAYPNAQTTSECAPAAPARIHGRAAGQRSPRARSSASQPALTAGYSTPATTHISQLSSHLAVRKLTLRYTATAVIQYASTIAPRTPCTALRRGVYSPSCNSRSNPAHTTPTRIKLITPRARYGQQRRQHADHQQRVLAVNHIPMNSGSTAATHRLVPTTLPRAYSGRNCSRRSFIAPVTPYSVSNGSLSGIQSAPCGCRTPRTTAHAAATSATSTTMPTPIAIPSDSSAYGGRAQHTQHQQTHRRYHARKRRPTHGDRRGCLGLYERVGLLQADPP